MKKLYRFNLIPNADAAHIVYRLARCSPLTINVLRELNPQHDFFSHLTDVELMSPVQLMSNGSGIDFVIEPPFTTSINLSLIDFFHGISSGVLRSIIGIGNHCTVRNKLGPTGEIVWDYVWYENSEPMGGVERNETSIYDLPIDCPNALKVAPVDWNTTHINGAAIESAAIYVLSKAMVEADKVDCNDYLQSAGSLMHNISVPAGSDVVLSISSDLTRATITLEAGPSLVQVLYFLMKAESLPEQLVYSYDGYLPAIGVLADSKQPQADYLRDAIVHNANELHKGLLRCVIEHANGIYYDIGNGYIMGIIIDTALAPSKPTVIKPSLRVVR